MGVMVRMMVLVAAWCAVAVALAVVLLGAVPRWQEAGPPAVMGAWAVAWLLPLLLARVMARPWTSRQPILATRASAVLVMALLLQGAALAAFHLLVGALDPAALEATALAARDALLGKDTPPVPPPVNADPATANASSTASGPPPQGTSGAAPAVDVEAEQVAAVKRAVASAPRGSMFLWTDKEGNTHITQEAPGEGARHVVVETSAGTYAEEGAEPARAAPEPRRAAGGEAGKPAVLRGVDGTGSPVSESRLRGAPTLVVHVLPGCGACARQAKILASGGPARVVWAVRTTARDVPGAAARTWAEKHGLPPADVVAMDAARMPVGSYPQTAGVDARGTVLGWRTGVGTAAELAALLRAK